MRHRNTTRRLRALTSLGSVLVLVPVVAVPALAVPAAGAIPSAAGGSAIPAAAGGSAIPTGGSGGSDPSIVRISEGVLRGAVHERGRLFANIPYAAPPVGERRWRPPAPPAPWPGVRPATWPGPNCAQAATSYGQPSAAEDCLTLNVYTPRATRHARRLPVMVWIHGGGFVNGSGSAYNASVMADKGDVVVVTINYRLGPFGFLVHPSLDTETPDRASGNYGLADQQAALRWVRRNIGAFGGNARNVTIFGESAGGSSVCAHLASPTAKGLFHRAIAQSGCSSLEGDRASAGRAGTTLATAVGCPDPATAATCLRGKSVQQLLGTGTGSVGDLPYAPVPGGKLLPRSTSEAFASGRFHRVPFMHGTTHDEGTFLLLVRLGSARLTEATYRAVLNARYGANAAAVAAEYPASEYPTPTNAMAAVITDSVFACPAVTVHRQASRRVPLYAYEFNDRHAPSLLPADFPLGAYHAAELQYIFQRTPVLSLVPDFTPQQLALSDAMIEYWTDFARQGTPNSWNQPRWPRAHTGKLLSLDPAGLRPLRLKDYSADHRCGFWSRLDRS